MDGLKVENRKNMESQGKESIENGSHFKTQQVPLLK